MQVFGHWHHGTNIIKVQQAQVSKYRSKNYKGEDSEWQAILRWALLREEHDRKHAQTLQSVELVSQPMPKTEELALHLRQSVPMEGGKPIMVSCLKNCFAAQLLQ